MPLINPSIRFNISEKSRFGREPVSKVEISGLIQFLPPVFARYKKQISHA
jgi:hypothetical protein